MNASRLSSWFYRAETQVNQLLDRVDQWIDREQHIVITGLSRSGKSMLFTALIAQLNQRVANDFDPLPLLTSIPRERIERVELQTHFDGLAGFPFADNLIKLQQRQWPKATDKISAFRLTLRLKHRNAVKQKLLGSKKLSLFFYDYPGEWLMDLPLESLNYAQWSAQVFSQLAGEPQASLAKTWLQSLRSFDFDQAPTEAALNDYISLYQAYLLAAKAQGVSLLQPGALILPPPGLVVGKMFAPLPNKVLSDGTHPWTQAMTAQYQQFIEQWVSPFKQRFFNQADKQVILIDVLEGLSFGRAYLDEMKEAMNHLSQSFIYGKRRWFQRLGIKPRISQVGFVATKMDLIPLAERERLKTLLSHMTEGVRHHLSQEQVEFEHFLIASLLSAKPEQNAVCYKDSQGQSLRQTFEPIPTRLADFPDQEFYPRIQALPPKMQSVDDWQSLGLDELMDYFLKGALK